MSSTEVHDSQQDRIEELSLLFEISQILDQSLDLKQIMQPVLTSVSDHLGMIRGAMTILNRNTEEIMIEAAYGLSPTERQRGRYKLGEGITGKVVLDGQPRIIPHIADEPDFLNRTGAHGRDAHSTSFICVPIKIGTETVGTFSVVREYINDTKLQENVRILTVVSSMIAQAVKIRRSYMEEREALIEENNRLHRELEERFQPSNIVGKSKAMQNVYDMIAQVSRSEATVLVRGESGTGKELVARAIHYNSPRATKPLIKVSCAALPETIIESELFGHERGAFTGAVSTRKGRFEAAHGGTIFLDEIGDLTPLTQVKLLRVLQEREFERVGGNETIRTNVRVIAATNRNLEQLMEEGLFREDLYYRLSVFPIHIPPLRERRDDVLLLADYFIDKYAATNHKTIQRISTPAIDLLSAYHWPGNVRELENSIERAVLLSLDGVIHSHHLPPSLQSAESTDTQIHGSLQETLDKVERELLMEALKSTKGNMAHAARMLDITERIMGLRVKKYRINSKAFRQRA